MSSGRDSFAVMLANPLCACSGPGGGCEKRVEGIEDGEATLPAEAYNYPFAFGNEPVCACDYEPDNADPIDVEFSWHLASADHPGLSKLMIKRKTSGEYLIDGRHVSIHWGTFGPGPCRMTELLASEETEDGDWDSAETPLDVYLRQVLDVTLALGGQGLGATAIARVPPNERLSFLNVPSATWNDPQGFGDDPRVNSMKRACEEARLREEAVEVYERGEKAKADDGLPRVVSASLSPESKIPPLPRQRHGSSRGRVRLQGSPPRPGLSSSPPRQQHVRPSGSSQYISTSSSRVTAPASPPAPVPAFTVSRLSSGIPSSTTRIRKV